MKIITDENFENTVLKSEKVFVVDFFSEWCPPCKAMEPVMEQLARELDGSVDFGKLDVGVHMRTSSQYGVMAVPTFIIFKGGQPVKRLSGVNSKDKFKTEIEKLHD